MNKKLKIVIIVLLSLIFAVGAVSAIYISKVVAQNEQKDIPYSSEYKAYPDGQAVKLKENCKWRLVLSSDKKVANPELGGKIEPGKIGTAEITIHDLIGRKAEKVKITVAHKQRIAIEPRRIEADFGESIPQVRLRKNSKEDNHITYKADNEDVISVDKDGNIKVNGAGKTRLTAVSSASDSFHEARTSIPVRISKQSQTLKPDKKEYSVCITDKTTAVKVKSNTDNKISFKSKNESIAKVSKNGKIEPVALGSTKIQIVQEGDKNHSETKQEVKITIRQPNSKERIQAAIEWAKMIAADDNFTYGGDRKIAWKGAGCYFCGTTKRKVELGGQRYAKTYTCMPFVTAAYAHGAQDPEMLKLCQNKNSLSLTDENFEEFSCWHLVGRCNQLSMSDLQPGDVLCSYSADNQHGHLCMYIGDDQIAEAAGASWSSESITVRSGASKRLAYYSKKPKNYVMRYNID